MRLLFTLLAVLLLNTQQDKVLICESSSAHVYHLRRCLGLNNCTHIIEAVTVNEAIRLGRRPCLICYPSATRTTTPQPPNSTQCRAITKKGTRCSRNARSNGYCWQHGG